MGLRQCKVGHLDTSLNFCGLFFVHDDFLEWKFSKPCYLYRHIEHYQKLSLLSTVQFVLPRLHASYTPHS